MTTDYPRNTTVQPTLLDPNPHRTMPKVPGLNAQPLGPSIGTDHWRTTKTALGKPHPMGKARANHQTRPVAGRANPENARPAPKPKPSRRKPGTGRAARAARARAARKVQA